MTYNLIIITVVLVIMSLRTLADQPFCKLRFDSVLMVDNDKFYFRKRNVWLFRNNSLDAAYPKPISDLLSKGPKRIDASVYVPKNGHIYFFRRNRIFLYKYDATNKMFTKRKVITKFRKVKSYPRRIDFAFMQNDNEIYIVNHMKRRGQNIYRYWKITERRMKLDSTVYRLSNVYPQIVGMEVSAAHRMPGERELVVFEKNKFVYIGLPGNREIMKTRRIFRKKEHTKLCKDT